MTIRRTTMVVGLLVGVFAFLSLALGKFPLELHPVALYQVTMHCDALCPAEPGTNVTEPGYHGTAEAQIELVDNFLIVHGAYANLAGPIQPTIANGVHIHHDPVLDDLETIVAGVGNQGQQFGTFYELIHLSTEQQQMLVDGRLYMDIHTTAYPTGELRGMIVPARAVTPLLAER